MIIFYLIFIWGREKKLNMPYLKLPSFKTAISPSHRSQFDPANLTATQKLTLTASRIFGFRIGTNRFSFTKYLNDYWIGGNQRSGQRALRSALKGKKAVAEWITLFNFTYLTLKISYNAPIWDLNYAFPWFSYEEERRRKMEMLERRKLRIMMRGIKIGRQKGGGRVSLMNVFEIK